MHSRRGIPFTDDMLNGILLIEVMEGSIVNVPPQGGRKHPEQKMIAVDTKNILFVCGGAFDGIEKKIAQRLNTRVVGYAANENTAQVDRNNLLKYITPTDYKFEHVFVKCQFNIIHRKQFDILLDDRVLRFRQDITKRTPIQRVQIGQDRHLSLSWEHVAYVPLWRL